MRRFKFPGLAVTAALSLFTTGVSAATNAASAQAFSVVPTTQDFAPTNRAAEDAFVVENNTDQPMLLNLKVMTRGVGTDGQEINADTSDFSISPKQMTIGPNQKQAVRLQWQGAGNPDHELAYRVIVDQEPIKSTPSSESHAIRLALHFVAPIYVVPDKALPDVNVVSARAVSDAQNERFLQVNLANRGTAHAVIGEPTLTVSAGGLTRTIDASQLSGFGGENVLAGTNRTFLVSWPEGLPFEQPKVDLKFTPVR